jgi:hypothetical protein
MRSIPPYAESHRPSSSDLRFSTSDFRWIGAIVRPNLPVGAYIGGAIWRRKARKRRIFQALSRLFQAARTFPFFANASSLKP